MLLCHPTWSGVTPTCRVLPRHTSFPHCPPTVFTPHERYSRCSPAASSGTNIVFSLFSPCLHTEFGNKSPYQGDIFDKILPERGNPVHLSPFHAVLPPFGAVFTVFRRLFAGNRRYFSPERPVFSLFRSGTRCKSAEYTPSTRPRTPKIAVSTFYIGIMTDFVA